MPVDHHPFGNQIRMPGAFGVALRVADIVAGGRALVADVAYFGHKWTNKLID